MHFPYDLLKTFIAVADTGNFTKAGLIINRTQSAVSMQVKRLESEIGHALFERKGGLKGIRLTSKGDELLNYARRMLALHDEAVTALVKPDLEGIVRLGIPEDFSATFLPGILTRFSRMYPHTQIDVLCSTGVHISELLEKNELDLGVRSGVDSIQGAEILRRETIHWITSPSSFVHERQTIPLAVFHNSCTYRKWAIRSLQDAGRNYRIAFSSPSSSGIYAAVRAGLAVAVTGTSNLAPDVKVLSETEGYPKLPKALITLHNKTKPLSMPEKRLADHIRSEFSVPNK